MSPLPLVTVLVPARNEAADIEGCLEAIGAQDYPADRIEVIVVDGASSDGTASIAERALSQLVVAEVAVVHNSAGSTPSNLNIGLDRAKGEILCRVDARTRIEPHHVRTCVGVLTDDPRVSVVGGAQVAIARDATVRARGIARALNNRWSMGGSRYRRRGESGSSDTVYLGAFRIGDLRALGGWDEALLTNQDFDLNQRMAAQGLVWFDGGLRSGYMPRSTITELWQQYERFGRWKVRYWRHRGTRPNRRQAALLAFPPAAALVGGALLRRRPVWGATLGVALAVAIDDRGVDGHATLPERLMAVAAMLVVAVGWWTGVVRELLRA